LGLLTKVNAAIDAVATMKSAARRLDQMIPSAFVGVFPRPKLFLQAFMNYPGWSALLAGRGARDHQRALRDCLST